MGRMYVHVFIWVNAHMCISIYIYTVFLKKHILHRSCHKTGVVTHHYPQHHSFLLERSRACERRALRRGAAELWHNITFHLLSAHSVVQ
jgi:hypothetical protein